MGSPSNNPVPIPTRKRAGQPIDHRDWNRMVDAIRTLTERGMSEPRPQSRKILPPFWVTHYYDGSNWKYSVQVGYVTWQNIGDTDVAGYWTPTLGGTSLETEPAPEGTLPGNDAFVYVRVITDDKGRIENAPTIVSSASEETSTHHEPPDEEDDPGQAGDYYFLIAEFEEETPAGGTAYPSLVRRITGNKFIPNQLVEFDNVGTGKKIHRDYLPGTDDKHELRTIKEKDSSPQVKVKYDNEGGGGDEIDASEIIIEGNGISGSLAFDDCDGNPLGTLTWQDGLITSAVGLTIEAGCDGGTS